MASHPFDYQFIIESNDRSWSMQLVARLQEGIDEEELVELVGCLRRFDDYRVEGPLTAILEDAAAPLTIREGAGRALREMTTHATLRQRQKWHQSPDALLQKHALLIAERKIAEEEQLIMSIATDSAHPLHAAAIERLTYDFPEERFQKIKIAALSCPSPQVRLAAARALESDTPVIAEAALLRATQDIDATVSAAAVNTLCWFASKNLLLTSHQMRCLGNPQLQAEYNRIFNYSLDACLTARPFDDIENKAVLEHFDEWLAPLWQVLSPYQPPLEENAEGGMTGDHNDNDDWHPDDAQVDFSIGAANSNQADSIWDNLGDIWAPKASAPINATGGAAPKPLSKDRLLAELGNADVFRAPWQQTDYDWSSFAPTERGEIIDFVNTHKDHLVRCVGVEACLSLGLESEYILLLNDRALPVRRKACWLAKHMQPSARLAENLFAILKNHDTTGSFALETFDSWTTHAENSTDFEDVLLKLALHDSKEEVRARAASKLQIMQSKKTPFLESILLEPPSPTWRLHLTVLDDYFWAKTKPSFLERIMPIDSFEIQAMLAEIVTENN